MANKTQKYTPDELFQAAEQLASDYSLFQGETSPSIASPIEGLASTGYINKRVQQLGQLDVDGYIAAALAPAEVKKRLSATKVIEAFPGKIVHEHKDGALYAAEIDIEMSYGVRRIGFLAQNREVDNGVWKPQHHLDAVKIVRDFSDHGVPIVTFIDTPGADAGAEANAANQAHSISRLIAEMCNTHVPTVGIIYGLGYSGGAIPLASTNVLLALETGVFNTIQPQGLASIARQYGLSWQESARYVGLSSWELAKRRSIDGVIRWSPENDVDDVGKLLKSITSAIISIEKASANFTVERPEIMRHYQRSIERFVNPSPVLKTSSEIDAFSSAKGASQFPGVFGHSCRYLRYIGLRRRISATNVRSYGRLANEELPKGDLAERTQKSQESAFTQWYEDSEKLIYIDTICKAFKGFVQRRNEIGADRNRLAKLILGEPGENYQEARRKLCSSIGLYLYNQWKGSAPYNFGRLKKTILAASGDEILDDDLFSQDLADLSLRELMFSPELRKTLITDFQNVLIFDALYNTFVDNLNEIAAETENFHTLSADTMKRVLDDSMQQATSTVTGDGTDNSAEFSTWLAFFISFKRRGEFLKDVEEWKRIAFPRLSDALLVLITFFFESLLPRYFAANNNGKEFDGTINPVHIGKRKDFWNQLAIASVSMRIQRVIADVKSRKLATVDAIKDKFFQSFKELDPEIITSNPVNFPGFRLSVEKALSNKITPCGVVTGTAKLKADKSREVGVFISNISFQAGAFDMAGATKLCKLLVHCAARRLPVICFVSSGGMQTKEGPNALFSMSITNDRITRFIRDNDLPVIIFGFGDCTGGSQASFVTHPLVHTYYFSGADIPFAGRVVVPSFLPSQTTVANYFKNNRETMQGLVKHPFADDLDGRLTKVDPSVPVPGDSVEDVIERVLAGSYLPDQQPINEQLDKSHNANQFKPVRKVLIHARGCTANKLIRIAQQNDITVVLVQSDPDMDSVPADMMREQDTLVSLGGQTSDESYLNAHSVLAIADRQEVDALHPGIGFLSENERFARLVREHGINFIGPYDRSMEIMGNKSNAIHTAMANNVPVVPGSHGILTSADATAKVANEVGYPVLLKAVHGGGGKGIQIVRNDKEIKEAFQKVQAEARAAFGNGDLYLEKFVESMRHIEVQILRDSHGNKLILGLRDCSVQRNNQKVIEESASTMLPAKLEKEAYRCAGNLADSVDYIGAGTVEFIYDLPSDAIYFMEMNTRLQVEHPVTEWTTGISIVGEQYRIASGKSIKELKPVANGYSIEARVTAEKAVYTSAGEIDFSPTPGNVVECSFPEGDDIEVLSSVGPGKTISPFYDSMIAQVIVHAANRKKAISRLIEVLNQTKITGVCTNLALLNQILTDSVFQKGKYNTGYLPEMLARIDGDRLIEKMADTGLEQTDDGQSTVRIEGSDELRVNSPMTGIFYTTPSPSEPEYVKVGDVIEFDQTICQIEAMKIFTQLSLSSINAGSDIYQSDIKYEVVRINQSPGTQINSEDLVFVIKPLS
jgi:acetyl/propionyl-CoA carboxylase alpha subunit/acetyl-CoA carboxylase beta subunit